MESSIFFSIVIFLSFQKKKERSSLVKCGLCLATCARWARRGSLQRGQSSSARMWKTLLVHVVLHHRSGPCARGMCHMVATQECADGINEAARVALFKRSDPTGDVFGKRREKNLHFRSEMEITGNEGKKTLQVSSFYLEEPSSNQQYLISSYVYYGSSSCFLQSLYLCQATIRRCSDCRSLSNRTSIKRYCIAPLSDKSCRKKMMQLKPQDPRQELSGTGVGKLRHGSQIWPHKLTQTNTLHE